MHLIATATSAEVVDLDKAPTFWQIYHSRTPSQYFSIYDCISGSLSTNRFYLRISCDFNVDDLDVYINLIYYRNILTKKYSE